MDKQEFKVEVVEPHVKFVERAHYVVQVTNESQWAGRWHDLCGSDNVDDALAKMSYQQGCRPTDTLRIVMRIDWVLE